MIGASARAAVDHEIGKSRDPGRARRSAMHGLDDVAADGEIAQRAFGSESDRPLKPGSPLGNARSIFSRC